MEKIEIGEKQNELINVTEDFKRRVGRPARSDSGSYLRTGSVPTIWRDILEKYNISTSYALQEGFLMLLNMRDDFPATEYEKMLVKGHYVAQRRKFAEILSRMTSTKIDTPTEKRNDFIN